MNLRQNAVPAKAKSGATARSVSYATSPLLASKTPPWRSKFLVALVGLSFCGLLGRAAYVQVIGTDFFQKQGEIRYARTLELPASRGRILDRNGLILASSIPAPSLWAIPKDFDADKNQARARQAARAHAEGAGGQARRQPELRLAAPPG
jgi:cell division protein FtsI (penicillin-binding protein 3)